MWIIGPFAATLYGSTRVTYDIDIVVDLKENHIQALAATYPAPRYYADPDQMRDSAPHRKSTAKIDDCVVR